MKFTRTEAMAASESSDSEAFSEEDALTYTEEDSDEEPCTQITSDLRQSASPLAIPSLLQEREAGGPCTPPQAINRKLASLFIPETPTCVASYHDRGYLGKFSQDLYLAAWQGSRTITVSQTNGGAQSMQVAKTLHCRTLRWTVTDIAATPDNRFLIYSTIAPAIHLASIGELSSIPTMSVANVTDIHETLYLGEEDVEYGEGVWSLRWSPDQHHILAGSSAGSYVWDVGAQKVIRRFRHHLDDVNSVEYGDESGNLFFSGADDNLIFAYDLRTKGEPLGAFVGHLSGLTYLDSAKDGWWLLSNSKDQTAKLWDIRRSLVSFAAAKKERSSRDVPRIGFDYRWQAPRRGIVRVHPRDGSVTTYRGHAVLQTLIRAKFSPAYTSRNYVYSGSACGSVYIWDRYHGGSPIRILDGGHDDVVRDVDWHPHEPFIVSLGFDGQVVKWDC